MKRTIILLLLFVLGGLGFADEPAIDALVRASPLIVVAEPVFEKSIPPLGELSEVVLVKYGVRFRIKNVLKSDLVQKSGDTIRTRLAVIFDEDFFKPQAGKPVILFLRKTEYEANSFENTSVWFGVMPYTKMRELMLVNAIKEAAEPAR